MPTDLEEQKATSGYAQPCQTERDLIAKMKAKLEEERTVNLEIKCPKCDGALVEADFQTIKIDVCNECSGVWLDPGELAHVIDNEKDGGWFGKLFG